MDSLTIGRVAREAGVNRETLRYYERTGLIPKPARTHSGYRSYSPDTVTRIRFIRHAKELGFSLHEISELLSLRMDSSAPCAEVRERAERKIRYIEGKIAELRRMKRALTELANSCPGSGPSSECPILEALERQNGKEV